jgi:hypothetical protein
MIQTSVAGTILAAKTSGKNSDKLQIGNTERDNS